MNKDDDNDDDDDDDDDVDQQRVAVDIAGGCTPSWTMHANTRLARGEVITNANGVVDCQATCISRSYCTGIDWIHDAPATRRCVLTGHYSGQRFSGTVPGATHYDLTRNCRGQSCSRLVRHYKMYKPLSKVMGKGSGLYIL